MVLISGTKANGNKLKAHEIKFELKKIQFYCNGGETLEKVVQRSCEVCISGHFSSPSGQDSKQPALSEPD